MGKPIRFDIVKIADALEKMIKWAEHPAVPPSTGHTCGPEGNCDCDCMAWAYFCTDLGDARSLLIKLKEGCAHAGTDPGPEPGKK